MNKRVIIRNPKPLLDNFTFPVESLFSSIISLCRTAIQLRSFHSVISSSLNRYEVVYIFLTRDGSSSLKSRDVRNHQERPSATRFSIQRLSDFTHEQDNVESRCASSLLYEDLYCMFKDSIHIFS